MRKNEKISQKFHKILEVGWDLCISSYPLDVGNILSSSNCLFPEGILLFLFMCIWSLGHEYWNFLPSCNLYSNGQLSLHSREDQISTPVLIRMDTYHIGWVTTINQAIPLEFNHMWTWGCEIMSGALHQCSCDVKLEVSSQLQEMAGCRRFSKRIQVVC